MKAVSYQTSWLRHGEAMLRMDGGHPCKGVALVRDVESVSM
jgi:hypothetical protein